MDTIGYRAWHGLGDKLIDIVGLSLCCDFLKKRLFVELNAFDVVEEVAYPERGSSIYDERLFDLKDVTLIDKLPDCQLVGMTDTGKSLSPLGLYCFLKDAFNLSFEDISKLYVQKTRLMIHPSSLIADNIPESLTDAYGIHLRKSDKCKQFVAPEHIFHENTVEDFNIIIKRLKIDIIGLILNENHPSFFICSEDMEWKNEFCRFIIKIAGFCGKKVAIIEPECRSGYEQYSEYRAVLDMFCLSKCKSIYQGVKYTSFSIIAALIGNRRIFNYAEYATQYDLCLTHLWKSCLNINNQPENYELSYDLSRIPILNL
jgi:hypothetical protein